MSGTHMFIVLCSFTEEGEHERYTCVVYTCIVYIQRKGSVSDICVVVVMCSFTEKGKHEWYTSIYMRMISV